MKAILSPCLFFPDADTEAEKMKHSNHLLKVIEFIHCFLDLDLDKYADSPYDRKRWYVPNFEYENLNSNLLASKIFPTLVKMLNNPDNLDYGEDGLVVNNDETVIQNIDFILPQNENSFLRYLKYIKDHNYTGAFFIGLNNQGMVDSKIYIEDDYAFDVIKKPWLEKQPIFNNHIKKNIEKSPIVFPNRKLCIELEKLMFDEAGKISGNLKGAHFKKYAEVIAPRNNFEKLNISDPYEANTDYYKRKDGKYIISVDLIHGHFEVFYGSNELWFAEYSFSGEELYAPTSQKELDKMRQKHRVRKRHH